MTCENTSSISSIKLPQRFLPSYILNGLIEIYDEDVPESVLLHTTHVGLRLLGDSYNEHLHVDPTVTI